MARTPVDFDDDKLDLDLQIHARAMPGFQPARWRAHFGVRAGKSTGLPIAFGTKKDAERAVVALHDAGIKTGRHLKTRDWRHVVENAAK